MILLEFHNPYWKRDNQMFLEVLEVAENNTNLNVLRYSKKHLDTWMRDVISKNIF